MNTTDERAGWPFGLPPYHLSCGVCGWEFEAQTVDAGVPTHDHLRPIDPVTGVRCTCQQPPFLYHEDQCAVSKAYDAGVRA